MTTYSGTVQRTTDIDFVFRKGIDVAALMKEFSEYIWEIDTEQEFINHLLSQMAAGVQFIEGVGAVQDDTVLDFDAPHIYADVIILYRINCIDTEVI